MPRSRRWSRRSAGTASAKTLQWRLPYATEKPRFRATLDHVDPARSAPLEPPWPDLVLTIGRRPSMAALWIKERSGGRTRLVLFGKPSGMMDRFDLVVAGAEVQLPPSPNLVPIRLPLMRAKAPEIEAAVARWRGRLAPLPRPLIAILVGGPTVPFAFDARVSERLCRLATEIAGARRHAVRHHQPAHAARGGRRRCGQGCRRRRSCSSGRRAAPTIPISPCSVSPTASSSPATASR